MTRKDASADPLRESPNRWGKWKRRLMVAGSSLAVVAVCAAIRAIGGREHAAAQAPAIRPAATSNSAANKTPTPQDANATSSQQQIVATVNGEEIGRQELAQQCLAEFGKDVLETMMNKYLIVTYCDQHGVTVTKAEVDEEIGRLAKKFAIPVEQWLQMLKDERGIKPEQYANEIIWPMLALRKLAAERIQPTQQEIDEAFETQFGVAVRARIIVLNKPEQAQEVLAKVKAKPDDFGMLARNYSIDSNSASLNGLIQPIRHHVGDPNIERAAFQLQPGEISPVIEVGTHTEPSDPKSSAGAAPPRGYTQYVILKCEGFTEAADIKKEQVRPQLEEFVREKKLRVVAGEVFKKLQDESKVVNVYNDPQKRAQMPGVAATINGKTITVRELAEECIDRHGEDVLDTLINRKLLEQDLKHRSLTVTQKDIDAEIGRAAVAAGKLKRDGSPDVETWLKIVVQQRGLPYDKYVREAVWPSAALKLLAGDVKVSDQDLEQGYEANYGAKANVRAIVLDNQRRAQEVWQKARENPTVDFFGKLAEQYSVEAASKSNQGRVPPMHQFGGQPDLQDEVFKRMKPGEISGIVQVDDKFVILFLESFTKPMAVNRDEVRSIIYEDIHEKKARLAMAHEFDKLKDSARIDNYLTGKSQSPQKTATAGVRTTPSMGSPQMDASRDLAVPAAYQTTGLLPRNPSSAQRGGAGVNSQMTPENTPPVSGGSLPLPPR